MKYTKKELQAAVAYGMGVMAGLHNLSPTKKYVTKVSSNWEKLVRKHKQGTPIK